MASSLHRSWFAPLLILGVAWPQGPADSPFPDERSTSPATPNPVETELTSSPTPAAELWEHPGTFQNQQVEITVQMHAKLQSWNPFVTQFGAGEYSAWNAWADEQFPWDKSDFEQPGVRFYAARDSVAEWVLSEAEVYQRFTLKCRVRSIFANRPWLEVLSAKPLVRRLGEGSLIHGARGLEFMKSGAWAAAISEFERAAAGGIPEASQAELGRLTEICRKKLPLQPMDRLQRKLDDSSN